MRKLRQKTEYGKSIFLQSNKKAKIGRYLYFVRWKPNWKELLNQNH